MSYRGILSNSLYVNVDIEFEKVWDELSSDEQKSIISSNIDMIETNDLISELESRGFCITTEN